MHSSFLDHGARASLVAIRLIRILLYTLVVRERDGWYYLIVLPQLWQFAVMFKNEYGAEQMPHK